VKVASKKKADFEVKAVSKKKAVFAVKVEVNVVKAALAVKVVSKKKAVVNDEKVVLKKKVDQVLRTATQLLESHSRKNHNQF
jgi:uncharacterized protein (UPF0216 family)